jgi:MazG family protein
MARLRAPDGCPWDREQDHRSLRGSVLEEAYEVAAALDSGDDANLREELGDLLLQVVFHSQLGAETGRFDFESVARGICEKLVRRHPHVFGAETAQNSGQVLARWEEIKRAEKGGAVSIMDGITPGLPSLLYAEKVQKKAAKVGFDWPEALTVLAKVREETNEVAEAMDAADPKLVEEELGDLLFAVVNLSRKIRVEPEVALTKATLKFERRFRQVEAKVKESGRSWETMSLVEMDALWDLVKVEEKQRIDSSENHG